jgi:hypothetical protein
VRERLDDYIRNCERKSPEYLVLYMENEAKAASSGSCDASRQRPTRRRRGRWRQRRSHFRR